MTKEEYDKLIEEKRSFIRFEEEKEPDFESDQEAGLPMPPLFKEPSGGEEIPLPKNFEDLPIKTDFLDIINSRRSERVYTKEPISLLELSYIIWCAQGVEEIRGDGYMTMRTVPSGGGRHGFELYFAAMLIGGIILSIASKAWIVPDNLDVKALVIIAVIVVIGTAGGFSLFLEGVKYIGPVKGTLIACLEPATATVLSALCLGTHFGAMELTGFCAIMATVFMSARKE